MTDDKDYSNRFMLGAKFGPEGTRIQFLMPCPRSLNHEEALLLAAWLVTMVGDDPAWEETLKGVQNQ